MKIFISYRRADSTYLIGRIKDRLTSALGERSVFRDLDDIPAGIDFRKVLEQETNDCDVMLVIIGPQWVGIKDVNGNKRLFDPGDYTRIEVETGLRKLSENKAMVIPVLLMNATMPSLHDIPESISQLTYQNAISIRNDPDFNHDIERLIRDIKSSKGYAEEDIATEHFEPKTIYIAEGSFWMGGIPTDTSAQPHETPQNEAFLPSYRIGKYPVTNSQYEEFIKKTKTAVSPIMGWDGRKVPQGLENNPVTGLTWFESLAYCEWLGGITGRKYSLPNEAQWEKACRGGNLYLYPWGDVFDPARCNNEQQTIAPVYKYPAQNDFGCHDLVGNVLQWTTSLWGKKRFPPDSKYLYPWRDDGRNDIHANAEVRRVVRGSSINQNISFHRCSNRSGQLPDDRGVRSAPHGFRVAIQSI